MKKWLCLTVAMVLLLTGGIVSSLPAMAATNNLITNGDFHDDLTGWSSRLSGGTNMEVTADEYAVLTDSTASGEIYQIAAVEPTAAYKLSFRMKNRVANAVQLSKSLYMVDGAGASATNDSDYTYTEPAAGNFDNCYFGTATETPSWKTFETMINVPSRYVNGLRIILTFAADTDLAIDDIVLEKVSDRYGNIVNGTFDGGKDQAANAWGLANFSIATDADGNRYAQSDGTSGGSITQNMYVEPGTTLRFTFKMKNSMQDALRLFKYIYGTSAPARVEPMEGIKNRLESYTFRFGSAQTGEAVNTWRTYTVDVPVVWPDEGHPVPILFRLEAIAADQYLAIDDVSVSYIKDYANYVLNGDFESGLPGISNGADYYRNGWRTLNNSDVTVQEEQGNTYLKIVSKPMSNACIRTQLTLVPGRYKMSFRVKRTEATTTPLKVALNYADINLANTANDGYLNGLFESKSGIDVPVNEADTWETKTIYFSVGAKVEMHLQFPPNSGGAPAGTFYLDDVTMTEDKSSLAFTETISGGRFNENSYFQLETGDSNVATSISAARTAGRTTIPVTWHYVPETTGTSDKLALIVAVYETDTNGIKRLVSAKVVTEQTDISATAKSGANGLGVATLYTTMPIPENPSSANTVEVMRLDDLSSLTPYAEKVILSYE